VVEEILSPEFIAGFLAASLRIASPLLLATVGEIFAERSGILNLGIEGEMLTGAFVGFAITYFTGNIWLGIFAAIFAGALYGTLMAFMSVSLGTNQVLNGLAITLLGSGLGFFLFRIIFGVRTVLPYVGGFKTIDIPILSQVPIIGEAVFKQYSLVYLALILVPISHFVLFKTTTGLRIRATGENPKAVDTLGINVIKIRYACTIFGAALAGLSGAFLSLVQFRTFLSEMSAGRGFIAIALVIFSNWSPIRAFGGAFLFGAAEALQLRLQAIGFAIPYQFALMVPYALTLLVLIAVAKKVAGPAALGIHYRRG